MSVTFQAEERDSNIGTVKGFEVSSCIVLGAYITKEDAHDFWKNGKYRVEFEDGKIIEV